MSTRRILSPVSKKKIIIPKPSSGAVYAVQHNTATIHIPKWIETVSAPHSNFIYPAILETGLDHLSANSLGPIAFQYFHTYTCPNDAYSNSTTLIRDVFRTCARKHFTFIIFHIDVRVLENNRILYEGGSNIVRNHVIQLYAHRRSSANQWSVTLCDPNWAPLYSESPEQENIINSKHESDLKNLGLYYLNMFDRYSTPPTPTDTAAAATAKPSNLFDKLSRIHLHRCLNVNVCVPLVKRGICFTGLCASLAASEIYTRDHPDYRAENGDQLMLIIRRATMGVRNKAPDFVREIHRSPSYDPQKLSDIMRSSVTMPTRNPSPHRFTWTKKSYSPRGSNGFPSKPATMLMREPLSFYPSLEELRENSTNRMQDFQRRINSLYPLSPSLESDMESSGDDASSSYSSDDTTSTPSSSSPLPPIKKRRRNDRSSSPNHHRDPPAIEDFQRRLDLMMQGI